MSNNNNRNRQPAISAPALIGAAVGVVAGLAAVEHAQAQHENRESLIQGMIRWVREDVLDLQSGRRRQQRHMTGAAARRILTRADIAVLPVRTLTEEDLSEGRETRARGKRDEKAFCVICHDPYACGDTLMRLPCFHEYHQDCIKDYLESTEDPLCPVCRHPVAMS